MTALGVACPSEWLTIDQAMIDRFADATDDHQFIHIDPVAAAATPFGGTVAHGLLTLSLLPRLLAMTAGKPGPADGIVVNYGFDRVRFVAPVRVGSRIRAIFTLTAIDEKHPGRFQRHHDVIVEIDGADRPALTAIWLSQLFQYGFRTGAIHA